MVSSHIEAIMQIGTIGFCPLALKPIEYKTDEPNSTFVPKMELIFQNSSGATRP